MVRQVVNWMIFVIMYFHYIYILICKPYAQILRGSSFMEVCHTTLGLKCAFILWEAYMVNGGSAFDVTQ